MANNQLVGKIGETLAKNYLEAKGYTIVTTNLKTSYQEIDIIARKNGQFYFIEVKTRTSTAFGSAADQMSHQKIVSLKMAMARYCFTNKISQEKAHIDFVAIDLSLSQKKAKISRFKDIV